MVFTGTYEHTIDAKNRLAIPAEIRDLLERADGSGRSEPVYLYATLGEQTQDGKRALCLYTKESFDQRARELDSSELETEQLLEYERLMFSLSRRVDLDTQGRVRLPESLLKMTGLGTDVVLLGVKDHLEIRDRTVWQSYVDRMLAEQPQLLMNPRRAMRRPANANPSSER